MSSSSCINAALAEGFCASVIPVQASQPRSILAVGPTDFLMLERGTSSVVAVEDLDGDGIPESRRVVVSGPNLNHGLEITSTHLYASQSTTVYRWPYDPVTKTVPLDSSSRETVVENINADGSGGAPFGHTTRTLVIDEDKNILYVSVGSNKNIDADSFRSRIRMFPLPNTTTSTTVNLPFDFMTGQVFADGLRNEVGMTLDATGTLWGVGNSADRLKRADLGGDIHNDNPSEEMHKLALGQNYGYPFCWREYELDPTVGLGRGTTWAWPDTMTAVTDEQCRANFDQPVFHMPAHSAPLGIEFYNYNPNTAAECEGVTPFPSWMDGFAFIAYHGSWNRDIPTGYKVVYVEVSKETGEVVGEAAVDLLSSASSTGGAKWEDGTRPVDVSFDTCGRLLVTSDGTRNVFSQYYGDKVLRIEYNGPPPATAVQTETTAPFTPSPTEGGLSAPTVSPTSSTPMPMCSSTPCSGSRLESRRISCYVLALLCLGAALFDGP